MHSLSGKCPACGFVLDMLQHQAHEHATSQKMLGELAALIRKYKAHNDEIAARHARSNVGGR